MCKTLKIEVHGCEFAHGQYGMPDMSREELLKLYLKDKYPDYYPDKIKWKNTSVVFIDLIPLPSDIAKTAKNQQELEEKLREYARHNC